MKEYDELKKELIQNGNSDMWAILKFDRKKLSLLEKDLKQKLGKDIKIYIPKLRIQKYRNNKLINKDITLLGDYLFCFHKNLKFEKVLNTLKFSKGLKYFFKWIYRISNRNRRIYNKM